MSRRPVCTTPSRDGMEKTMMNSKNFRAAALDACRKLHGEAFNAEVFKSALEKCKRHMKNKYGSLDYEEEDAESGVHNVVYFYAESAKGTKQTWNGAKAAKPVVSIVPVAVVAPVAVETPSLAEVIEAIRVTDDGEGATHEQLLRAIKVFEVVTADTLDRAYDAMEAMDA